MTIVKIMPNKTLILTCNSSFGLANFRMNLIRRLQAEGYHIVAIAPQDTHSAKLEAAGVEFYDWNLKARSTSLWTEILAIFQLVRLYGIIKPDLCFHYTVKAVVYGAIAARLTKVNFVSVITGLGYVFLNRGVIPWLVKSLYRFILRYSSRTLFLNKSDRQEFLLLGLVKPDVAIVIPGEGIDVDFFSPAPRTNKRLGDVFEFLVVSRLLTDKGIVEFVEAVRSLRAEGFKLRGRLLGARGLENPAAIDDALINCWVHEGVVDYVGSTNDVRAFLADADCVVLPSYREGLPRALLEAAAMERPIIATDVAGCRDVVIDGETGFLCAVRDSASLAAAMRKILEMSHDERALMGFRGRNFIKSKFTESIVFDRYIDVLNELKN